MSKKSILDAALLSHISNVARGVKSDVDKETSEDESVSKTELLASNFDADLRLNSESDASNFPIETPFETLETKQEDNLNQSELFHEEKKSKFEFKLISKAEIEFSSDNYQNVTKGCKWSPDGSCIMTNSEDKTLRLFDLNEQMLNSEEIKVNELKPSLKMTEPEIIYDYAWYPYMNSSDPITACVFSTCKDNPIHLYDAYTGKIRCSYKGYNHLDELVNAYSIAFNSSATKIYCGYNKCIKIFDIAIPGKNYQDVKLSDDQYKMPGIISCIAFSKTPNGIYAAGSYTKFIGIFVESTNEPVCLIQTHKGGLTHLMFSSDGNRLFSGARKDSELYCWDIRNPGKLLQIFKRNVSNNQRIYFDLYDNEKYLASGNNDGTVSFWNGTEFDITKEDEPLLYSFKSHDDCVNGVSFHPTLGLLATSSGERKIYSNYSDSSDESENETGKSDISLKIWKHFL